MFGSSLEFYFPLSALINAAISSIVGVYILSVGRKAKQAKDIFRFCFAIALWSYAYFFWQIADTADQALFWTRVLMAGAILTAVFYFHLVINFLELRNNILFKRLLYLLYALSGVWLLLNTTPLFVKAIEPKLFFDFWPVPGSLYLPFLLTFGFQFFYPTYLLFSKYRRAEGDKRMQLLLLAAGGLIGFVGGSTNYFLWYDIPIAPWGNGLVVVYFVLTVYAILKYRLLNIEVVTAELFAALFFVILVIDTFLSQSVLELGYRLTALAIMVVFGVILIRSVRQEVQRRHEITKLARSLEKANLRLQELDRQKTEFLSIASHQLRTPLSIIKGYVELMRDGAYGKSTKKMIGVLNDMDESNERLVRLVDEFLNITRLEQGRTQYTFEKYDIHAMVTSVVGELRNRAEEKGLHIVWKAPKKAVAAVMDQEKIRHVVFNYVDNAIKYSTEGKITVTVEEEDEAVIVRVEDQGFGFDKEDEANFFQKFYRGRNVERTDVSGTGLGIYVCKKFIEMHEGHVWAKSAGLGKGSEFGFSIPKQGPKNTKNVQG